MDDAHHFQQARVFTSALCGRVTQSMAGSSRSIEVARSTPRLFVARLLLAVPTLLHTCRVTNYAGFHNAHARSTLCAVRSLLASLSLVGPDARTHARHRMWTLCLMYDIPKCSLGRHTMQPRELLQWLSSLSACKWEDASQKKTLDVNLRQLATIMHRQTTQRILTPSTFTDSGKVSRNWLEHAITAQLMSHPRPLWCRCSSRERLGHVPLQIGPSSLAADLQCSVQSPKLTRNGTISI
jgi:hypothetical protein